METGIGMEAIWDRIGAIVGAVITALGGFYMYDRKVTHERLSKVEEDVAQSKTDIKVMETRVIELKEDTEEIKSSLRDIISLLTKRHK